MTLLSRRVHLGAVDVALHTEEPAVLAYLADFYTITKDAMADATWTVDARLGDGSGMRRNPWGVRYAVDEDNRVLRVRADSVLDLAMTTRKALREALVEYCEQRGFLMLHASAVADDHRVMLVVGDKGSGKTTLSLKAALHHGCRYLSNDHLILYAEPGFGPVPDRLVITSLPTPIPLKVGTFLDLEDWLPPPWDDEGLDVAVFRAMPAPQRYRHDTRVLYTYPRLGQDNPTRTALGRPENGFQVAVVLARYTPPNQPIGTPQPVDDPHTALWPHVRFDWVFNPALNTQHLPRSQRDQDAYAADAHLLIAALADRSNVVSWMHAGDPRLIIDYLRTHS